MERHVSQTSLHGGGLPPAGQKSARPRAILRVHVLPGIGDTIYTWYKLDHYVNSGYAFAVISSGGHPRRMHQLQGILRGLSGVTYGDTVDYDRFRLIPLENLLKPPQELMLDGAVVLHPNAFVEAGIHLDEAFMPSIPMNYHIPFEGSNEDKARARKIVGDGCVVMYTSSERNNSICRTHYSLKFWEEILENCCEIWGLEDPPVVLVGAGYDEDLTSDVMSHLQTRGKKVSLLIDQPLGVVTETIRASEHAILYESGLLMIADLVGARFLHLHRMQEGRSEEFVKTGIFNPDTLASDRYLMLGPSDISDRIRGFNE